MKDRIYWIRFSNKFLIGSGVLAIICAIVVRLLTPTSLQRQALNTRQHSEYRQAMSLYHARYGRLPVHCTNITELAQVLNGENVNGDNSDKVKFFSREMPLKKRVHDGYGFPFDLSTDDSGTNFVLQSYGSKRYRENRIKTSTPLKYNISELYIRTLAEVEAELRARMIQTNALSGTNQSVKGKETNHVNSISQ